MGRPGCRCVIRWIGNGLRTVPSGFLEADPDIPSPGSARDWVGWRPGVWDVVSIDPWAPEYLNICSGQIGFDPFSCSVGLGTLASEPSLQASRLYACTNPRISCYDACGWLYPETASSTASVRSRMACTGRVLADPKSELRSRLM